MTACAYRSAEPVLHERIAALRARRAAEAPAVDAARGVLVRRVGRAVGGAAGAIFGLAAFAVALASLVLQRQGEEAAAAAVELLLGGWIAAIVAGALGRVVARSSLVLADAVGPPLCGDAAEDLARLERFDPLRDVRAAASRWERASNALPLAALSLLTPLTLHWLVYALLCVSEDGSAGVAQFGRWVALSALIVGHAHLALLVTAVRWASSLRTKAADVVRFDVHRSWGNALFLAIGVACLPGAVLVGLPPILVGLTGILFVPAMYVVTANRLVRERAALETKSSGDAGDPLPVAG